MLRCSLNLIGASITSITFLVADFFAYYFPIALLILFY